MAAQTLLFIILAGIIALCISLFFYFYRSHIDKKLRVLFSFLRFISLFALLLLLINPKIKNVSYVSVKPVLAVAVDNSASILHLKRDNEVKEAVAKIKANSQLNERFDVDIYRFGESLKKMDSLNFKESRTDVSGPLINFSSIYKKRYVPLLITDGNATLGRDYTYGAEQIGLPTNFIVVGDTLRYEDLNIDRINVNRYAYLNNEFPVEVILKYTGDRPVKTKFQIFSNGKIVHTEPLNFDGKRNGIISNIFLPAKKVGINQYTTKLVPLDGEVNTVNNVKNFAVEVIDQKAKIALLYSYVHPDLGAFKKAIESNRLREVSISNINDFDIKTIDDYDLLMLFEPNAAFAKVYDALKKSNANRFTILADQTDYNFLNQNQNTFSKNNTSQGDPVRPRFNPNFSAFLTEELDFSDFPPVMSGFGAVHINGDKDVLLYKNIGGVPTEDPLLAVTELEDRREVLFMARDIWQWRAQSYLNTGSFENFDGFVAKLVQYSASKNKRERLRLDYDSFYYGAENSVVSTQYMDKNYVFDPNARLVMQVRDKKGGKLRELPMILNGNRYAVNLDPLEAGDYDFTVQVKGGNISSSGSFTIIPYDVERQAQNANWPKIKVTAAQTGGRATTLKNMDGLIENLLKDSRYTPVQKEITKTEPLIALSFLLFIIIAALAVEWLVRKYNGLL